MNEETVTAAFEFDDAAIVSAIEQVQSQISVAESARISESVAAESVRVSERTEIMEQYTAHSNDLISLMLFGCIAVGCIFGLLLAVLTAKR